MRIRTAYRFTLIGSRRADFLRATAQLGMGLLLAGCTASQVRWLTGGGL